MNITELAGAYRELLAAAGAITDTAQLPPVPRATVDWTLSHVALSDTMLATAAARVRDGLPAEVDNRDAMDERAIAALVDATTHAERVDRVRANGEALVATVRTIPDERADTLVRLRIVDRSGRQVVDERRPWSELVRLRATEHLPGHAARIAAAGAGRHVD
ncbi:hypothetical protein AB0J86_37185 [Micromonospora sp. NPDC049559]|uniref:hypothetical protein n=1 Tax=Micromonospora sp. NPDC049559 TaxID=3155923 RepID=UPI00342EA071